MTSELRNRNAPTETLEEILAKAPPRGPEHEARRRAGAKRLEALYSHDPEWRAKAAKVEDFWAKFWDSQPNT